MAPSPLCACDEFAAPSATVYIVDDDAAVRDTTARLVRLVGFKAETFGSGQEFLDSYNGELPGCILLDVQMPDLSGLDVQRALKLTTFTRP